MKSQNGTISILRFVFHPEHNPFLSLLWERTRQNPEQFLRKQFVSLSIVLAISLLTLLVFELLKVNPLLRGGWLLDAVVLAHIIASSVYSPDKLVPLHQFWREVNRHDLLLTGAPALWLVLARGFCDFVFQAHFAFLCLPFYAAAFAMGAPIEATLLALILSLSPIALRAFAFMGWWYWFLFSLATRQRMVLPLRISPLWENVPFLLQQPICIYAWQLPAWTVVFALLASATVWSVMSDAWSLEQRLIPSQISVRRWQRFSGWVFWILLWGLGWAYLPIGYVAKVAITLCLLRIAISMTMLDMLALTKEHPQKAWKPMAIFWGTLTLDGIMLAFCAFVGTAEGQGNNVLRALTIGSALSLIHAISFAISLRFWLRLPQRNLPTNVTSTISFIWLLSPASLLIAFHAPQFSWLGALAGIQGWLVPLSMVGTLKLPFPLPAHFQFVFPSWWLMASVQLAWSFLLFAVERRFAPAPQEAKPYTLTPEHPLFGWLVRLEDKMMERLDNALVNVQIRWQRHRFIGYLYASAVLALLGFVVIAIVALLPPLWVWLSEVLLVLPLRLCALA